MKKLLYIFLFLPVFAPAQVQMFFTSDSSAFITSPLDVDSLFYWFDASQGVFDSVGSVISNNQGVGEWKDLSGRGHHVTQGTNGARPQYQATGGPNNYPALYFDGSNDFLASAAHLWESDDLTFFVVMRYANATKNASETVYSKNQGSTNNRQFVHFARNSTTGTGFPNPYMLDWYVSDDGTGPGVIQFRFNAKSASYRTITIQHFGDLDPDLFVNNSAQSFSLSTGTGDGTIYNSSATKFAFGSQDIDSTPTAFLEGYISEFIGYSRALTTAERGAIEAYLNHKYKIF